MIEHIKKDNHDHADGCPQRKIFGKTIQTDKPPWQCLSATAAKHVSRSIWSVTKAALLVKVRFGRGKEFF
ncbi:hypothetical protein MASR1M90_08780 [Desulfovibrionales bacterium]